MSKLGLWRADRLSKRRKEAGHLAELYNSDFILCTCNTTTSQLFLVRRIRCVIGIDRLPSLSSSTLSNFTV